MEALTAARLVVVEDHPLFRDQLCQTLQGTGAFRSVEACKDLPIGREAIERERPDLLLVDLGLPSGSGLNLIRLAQVLWGDACCTAVLTVTGNEEYLLQAVEAGACGFIFKSALAETWSETALALLRGESPLSAPVAQSLLRRLREKDSGEFVPISELALSTLKWITAGYTADEAASRMNSHPRLIGRAAREIYKSLRHPLPRLSPRELELMRYLDRGCTFRECAELMDVGESTTKTQAHRAYQKLGASNLQSALYEARQAGLLS